MKSKSKDEYGSKTNLVANMSKNEDAEMKSPPLMHNVKEGENMTAVVPEPPEDRVLTPDEKSFLLCVERGDTATAKGVIEAMSKRPQIFDINCVDAL